MSGPVWKKLDQPTTCSECGAKIDRCRAVGNVVDGEFRPTRRFCDPCYEALGGLRDQVA